MNLLVLIDKFTGRDLRGEKVKHVRVTPFYVDATNTIRLGVKFQPEATGDPEIKRKLQAIWNGLEHWKS